MKLGTVTMDCPACGAHLEIELTAADTRPARNPDGSKTAIVEIVPILPTHLCPGPDGGEPIPVPLAA